MNSDNNSLFTNEPAPATDDSLFTDEAAPQKSTNGFFKNAGSDILNNAKTFAGTAKTLVDPANLWESAAAGSFEPTKNKLSEDFENLKNIPQGLVEEGKRVGGGELLTGHPIEAAKKLGNAIYEKPLTTALDFAPLIGGEGAPGESEVSTVGKRLEANATANALDLGTFGVKKLSKGIRNPEEMLLGINKEIKELIPDLIGPGDTAASKFQKLLNSHKEAGNSIGQIVDSTSQKLGGNLPEVDDAIATLNKESSKYEKLTSARNVDIRAELQDAVEKLKGLKESGNLNFRNLSDLKSEIGDAYHNPNLDNPGIDKSYHTISDAIDDILERTTKDNPEIKEGFDKAKRTYKLTSNLLPAMKRGVSREVAGTGGGLSNAALGAGAVFGHPLTAAAGFTGKTIAKLVAPDLAPNLAYKAINSAKGMPTPPLMAPLAVGGIDQAVNDYLKKHYSRGE